MNVVNVMELVSLSASVTVLEMIMMNVVYVMEVEMLQAT